MAHEVFQVDSPINTIPINGPVFLEDRTSYILDDSARALRQGNFDR